MCSSFRQAVVSRTTYAKLLSIDQRSLAMQQGDIRPHATKTGRAQRSESGQYNSNNIMKVAYTVGTVGKGECFVLALSENDVCTKETDFA